MENLHCSLFAHFSVNLTKNLWSKFPCENFSLNSPLKDFLQSSRTIRYTVWKSWGQTQRSINQNKMSNNGVVVSKFIWRYQFHSNSVAQISTEISWLCTYIYPTCIYVRMCISCYEEVTKINKLEIYWF